MTVALFLMSTPDAPTFSVQGPRFVRVAVVQLAYHPAIAEALEDPLFDPKRERSSLWPDGASVLPKDIQEPFKELRSRVRKAYVAQLGRRVDVILEHSKKWSVRIVVFPEYSIPHELLERMATTAPDVVVVAGTHFVDSESRRSEVYQRLGATPIPVPRNAVCPILYQTKAISIATKIHPIEEEEKLKFVPGKEWRGITMPNGIESPMGILICRDLLQRDSEAHRSLIAKNLEPCRFLAVPSLTPWRSVEEDFSAKCWEQARRLRRPVLYANDAAGGGTSVFVDEGRRVDLENYPVRAGLLSPGEEGMIVADVNLGYEWLGDSTPYDKPLPVVPFGATTFVYQGCDSEYAKWLEDLAPLVEQPDGDEFEQTEAIRSFLTSKEAPIRHASKTRKRRLQQLSLDTDNLPGVEHVRLLTREVVLPEDVLPLPVVRAAMAQGAAAVIAQWVDQKNLGEFGPVVTRLRAAWEKEKKDDWTPTLLATATAVQHEVAGDATRTNPAQSVLKVAAYEEIVLTQYRNEDREAIECLVREDFSEGRERFRRILDQLEALIRKAGASNDLVQQAERCRMHIGLATLNLQEKSQAREILFAVDSEKLKLGDLLQLISGLGMVGEVERAKALLPLRDTIPNELTRRWEETRQSLQIAEGIIPEPLGDDEGLVLGAANLYLAQNNDEQAARSALDVLQREKQRSVTRTIATHVLFSALGRTVHDWPITPNPPAKQIPLGPMREEVVQRLEENFVILRSANLPEAMAKRLSRLDAAFRAWTKDYDAPALVGEWDPSEFEEDEPSHPNFADRDRAFDLVRKGDVDEALRILPPDPHPWRRRADEVDLLAHGKRFEQALEKAIALQRDFPDRPRIECALAELYAIARNHPDALKHAERAFVALPGIGYRLLFAESLVNVDKYHEAFQLLEGFVDDDRSRVQHAIAATAMLTDRLPVAEHAWKRYAEKKPDDWMGLMNLAEVQFRLHRLEDAAKTSHDAFVRHGDELPPNALYRCGVLQAVGVAVESERVSRIKAIAKKMHERFPKDAQAEQYRFELLAKLGELPADADPIDFNALVARGTMYRGHGLSTLIEHIKAQNEFLGVVQNAAQMGALPISTMVRLANNDPARFLTRLFDGFGPSEDWLCPPISLANAPPAVQLQGATILLGQLELLLLLKLNLFEPLQNALGPNGGLSLFPHVKQQIISDATDLRTRVRREKLEEVEALIRKLEPWPEAKPEENVPVVDWPAGEEDEPEYLSRKARPIVHIHAYLRFLKQKGVLTADDLAGLEQQLGLRDEPNVVLSEPLPERIGFTFVFVEKLDRVGVLEKVLRAFSSQIVLAAATLAYFRNKRNDVRVDLAAAQLADQAFEIVASEKIGVLRLPQTNDVPPLRKDESRYYKKLVREPLQASVAYRKAVLAEPNRWRLTAEYFGTTGLGAPDFVKMLAWSNVDQVMHLDTLVRRGAARDITLPSLVRYLVTNEKEADDKLRLLASAGFADALGPKELLRLDKQYGGLDGAEPKRLLQAMEWIARARTHLARDLAQTRIAYTYAAAVFDAYCATDRSEQEQFRVLEQLFGRLERLGEETTADPLDYAFTFLAGRATDTWQSAWKPNDEKTHIYIDENAAILRLWRSVHSWCEVNLVRRAAFGRAMRALWSALTARKGGPPEGVAKTLFVLLPSLKNVDKEISLLEPTHEAISILSSSWEVNSFATTDPGDLVERSVEHFSAGAMWVHGGRSARASVQFGDSVTSIPVAIPLEALFLRLSRSDKERVVEDIQRAQGPYDGIAYEFLREIEQHPEDQDAQREYALYITSASFRLVQDDPSYLHRWKRTHHDKEGPLPPLVLLLKILSEPNEPLPEDISLFQILHDRANDEPGKERLWSKHKRVDGFFLLRMASEIPGVFPAFSVVVTRLQDEYAEREIAAALDRITQSENHPIARVANEAYFLRVAASRRPYLTLGGKKIDLRDELGGYLEGLLERVIADPPSDTMAFFEPSLLRVCGGVIQRLALPDHTPIREGIFWTYRLYQWLCLQLEAISPDARLDGMRRLAALAPPVNNPHDILDPFGFGRTDLDIRLATVLHTLAHLHILDLPEGVDKTNLMSRTPARVSTPKIEQRLLELAQMSYQGPNLGTVFLDWHFPGNVADMALYTLLNVNSARFADMSEESRLRRFNAIPKNLDAIDKEHEGEQLLWDLVLTAALNHPESLTPRERQVVEAKVREMQESPRAARYCRGMVVAFFAAGEAQFEAEAFTRVLEDPTDRDFGSMVSALFLTVANRDPAGLEAVVRNLSQGLAEKGADVAQWVGRGLARVVNMGKPEARKVTRTLLLRLAKEKPFADDMHIRELLTTFNIRENTT